MLRLLRLVLHLARAAVVGALVFPFLGPASRAAYVQRWSAHLLAILAVRLEVSGGPERGAGKPAVIIANHISWLDIFAINSVHSARFIAKSEVQRWPLLGRMCKWAGTLFVERGRRHHVAHINRQMTAALREGDTLALFPEGTATAGDLVKPFNASLLQPALACGVPLQPVAISYTRDDGSLCTEADYHGNKSMFDSLVLMLTQPVIRARLQFLPALDGARRHRRELADEAARQIASTLDLPLLSRRS